MCVENCSNAISGLVVLIRYGPLLTRSLKRIAGNEAVTSFPALVLSNEPHSLGGHVNTDRPAVIAGAANKTIQKSNQTHSITSANLCKQPALFPTLSQDPHRCEVSCAAS